MHIPVMAAPSTAKPRRLIVEADHERTPSVAAARARRLSRDATHGTHPSAPPHAR